MKKQNKNSLTTQEWDKREIVAIVKERMIFEERVIKIKIDCRKKTINEVIEIVKAMKNTSIRENVSYFKKHNKGNTFSIGKVIALTKVINKLSSSKT